MIDAQKQTADDNEQLRRLGYEAKFDRSMGLWANFSLGFTYLSPVVGVYTLFASSMVAGGPPMFWSYLLVGIGQLLVCLVFCEVVSQYPIAGGIFPWAQQLVNVHWAWMAGWIYMWALWTTIAAVAVGSGPYLLSLLGSSSASQESVTVVALSLILASTLLNLSGTRILARVAIAGFVAELIGALVVGGYLLVFERIQPIGVLFDTFQIQSGGSYLPAFLAASLAGLFLYYGFEACGDVAEEVPNPSQQIPKAMRMTIYIGGAAAMFTCLAFILALPNIPKVISGEDTDPIQTVLMQAFGPVGSRAVILVVGISFLSCGLSLQAAASRLLFAFARDRMIIGHKVWSRVSEKSRVPTAALIACGVMPAIIAIVGYFKTDALTAIVSFAAIGIYIAFQMIVLGALIARRRGWKPSGSFTLGNRGKAVTVAALCYGVLAIVNIGWPRAPETPWFINYSVALSTAVVISAGLAYLLIAKPTVRKVTVPGSP
jgi:amino acid transporter